MLPSTLPRPTGCNPFHFAAMTGLLALLSVAYVANLAAGWVEAAAHADPRVTDPRPVPVSVGRHGFSVPANMIPSPAQRVAGSQHDRLSLDLSWPALSGYTGEATGATPWITVDLIASSQIATLGERLDSVYRRLAATHDPRGPAGLALLDMSQKAGAGDDVIVFETGRADGFIARCLTPADGSARCFRDIRLAPDLVVSYWFQRSSLASWGRMDRRILDRIDGFRVRAAIPADSLSLAR